MSLPVKLSTLLLLLSTFSAQAASVPESTQAKLTARLKEIVDINSGTANIAGVTKVQKIVSEWLEDLGFKTELRSNPLGEKESAPLLLATLAGESAETLVFSAHSDTVFEPSAPFQKFEIRDDGTAIGPGVIDDKGGLVVLSQALKDYIEGSPNKKPKYTLVVEITPNEETGSLGFHELFAELSKKAKWVFGLEPAYHGGIVEGRKGNVWYEISVAGKESHAGANHEKGVNACDILANKIDQLRKLTDYKRNVTVSVGRMEGGQDKYNIVCGWAKAKLDTRVPSPAARSQLNSKIEAILKDPRISFKIVDETAPMALDPATKPYIKKYLDLIEKYEGKRPSSYFTGGVGDVNHFARPGLPILDGLGPVGEDLHTPQENIVLGSLVTRAKVLTEFLFGLK